MRHRTLTLSLLCLLGFAHPRIKAQNPGLAPRFEHKLDLLLGYNGFANSFGEIGIAWRKDFLGGHHPGPTRVIFASTELRAAKNFVWGPKVGIWIGGGVGGLGFGANVIAYTDGDAWSLRFRPEIGLGFYGFKAVYGYNIPLSNRDFERINLHNFSLVVLFSLTKLKTVKLQDHGAGD